MEPSDILKRFFEKQRNKYRDKFLKDICLSGRPNYRGEEPFLEQKTDITITTLLVPPPKTLTTRKKHP